ncbi:hypothetical protein AMAG_19026 [Allomyces macrogynus ATCC 38327]|uniref:DUF6604 domain-containing protein n=1 Tax=Allomyces macrogynus (strain ATCC 38327) TaxID=578462 RepID=A0A0L0SM39_ALLM3|nr:hypothetical protein AMAG_19026 [Allomyces macrogynus ATCC 38327]|eukprot:KNE63616.1 hypothetical protein AMAG_19026 [Allomyces macrogynus ATCC 38327]
MQEPTPTGSAGADNPVAAPGPKLPESLLDIHRQYKSDTNRLAAWLATKAALLGSHNASAAARFVPKSKQPPPDFGRKPPRLMPVTRAAKRKARKEAKSTATASTAPATMTETNPSTTATALAPVIVKTHDFKTLAQSVADAQAAVPTRVMTWATRAIRACKTCVEWFRAVATAETAGEQDAQHTYFIGVLETVVDILVPHWLASKDGRSGAKLAVPGGNRAIAVKPSGSSKDEEPGTVELITASLVTNTALDAAKHNIPPPSSRETASAMFDPALYAVYDHVPLPTLLLLLRLKDGPQPIHQPDQSQPVDLAEQFRRDKRFFQRVAYECNQFANHPKTGKGVRAALFLDVFTEDILEYLKSDRPTLTFVMATQVWLDIIHTLGGDMLIGQTSLYGMCQNLAPSVLS